MNNELENMQVYKIQGSHSSVPEDFNPIQKASVLVSFDAVFWHFPSGTEDRQQEVADMAYVPEDVILFQCHCENLISHGIVGFEV